MAKKKYLSKSVEDTKNEIVEEVLRMVIEDKINVVLLQGELGAGKTTFSQGILKKLGAEGPYTSPTFVIMKRYELDQIELPEPNSNYLNNFNFVYHLDCYRVETEDVLGLGWEEIISDSQNLVLVEWPEKIEKILPPHSIIKLNFEHIDENRRKILISKE